MDNFENYENEQATATAVADQDVKKEHENVIAGIVGAFLFALIGGGLYFIIYQFGYIAGICGLVTVVLSTFPSLPLHVFIIFKFFLILQGFPCFFYIFML